MPALDAIARVQEGRQVRARRVRRLLEHLEAYAFLLPAAIVLSVFQFYPILYAFFVSLLRWNLIDPVHPYVGWNNYVQLVHDPKFLTALGNTAYYAVVSVIVAIPLALLFAILLNRKLLGMSWYRTAFFVPHVTSLAAAAMVWQWLYHPDQFGLLNTLIGKIGLPPQQWLLDPVQAMPAMIAVAVWGSLGRDIVILLAGLQSIAPDYYEAAQLDGANSWQSFRHITFPLLSPTTYFILVISMIGALKVFALPLFLTGGGSLDRTFTIVYSIYQEGFRYFRMGTAAAQAYALFALIFLITMLQRRILAGHVHYDA